MSTGAIRPSCRIFHSAATVSCAGRSLMTASVRRSNSCPMQAARLEDAHELGLELPDLARHEVDDVVGDRAPPDAVELPCPGALLEAEQALRVERAQELPHEERVALGPIEHHAGQRLDVVAGRGERVREQRDHVGEGERPQLELAERRACLLDLAERDAERVGRVDLVVAEGAQEEQVAALRIGGQDLEQLERGRIGPLQIVQEEDEGCSAVAKTRMNALKIA